MANSNPRSTPSAAEWEAHRPDITHLWKDHALNDVMAAMELRGFHGTKATYKKKIKEWDLGKYVKSAVALEAARQKKLLQDNGRPASEILINGKHISDGKIARHLKRLRKYRGSEVDLYATNNSNSQSPGGLPAAKSSSTAVVIEILEDDASARPNPSTQAGPSSTNTRMVTTDAPSYAAVDVRTPMEHGAVTHSPRALPPFGHVNHAVQSNRVVPGLGFNLPLSNDFFGLEPFDFFPQQDPKGLALNLHAIHQAAGNGHRRVVELLLKAQPACCDIQDEYGRTPFWLAAWGGYIDVATMLADHGADINAVKNISGGRPIHIAAQNDHIEIVRFLIARGAELDAANKISVTPLWSACQGGHLDIARLLLAGRCARINLADSEWGRTPLHQACKNGHVEIVQLLLAKGADIDVVTVSGATSLWLAALHGHTETARLLLSRKADPNSKGMHLRSPLHNAALGGHLELVKMLLEHGASSNAVDELSSTPLMMACQQGHTNIVLALIQHGANLNSQDVNGWGGLWLAANEGHTDVAKCLLDRGALHLARYNSQRLPIHQAAQNGHFEIVKLLVEAGSPLDAHGQAQHGIWVTPLLIASETGHDDIVEYLLAKGAAVSIG